MRNGVRGRHDESLAGEVVQCMLPLPILSVINDYLQEGYLLQHLFCVILNHLSRCNQQLELEQLAPLCELALNCDVLLVEAPLTELTQSFLHVSVIVVVDESPQICPFLS